MTNLSTNEIMFDCQVDIINKKKSFVTQEYLENYIKKYNKFNGDEGLAWENYSSDNWEAVFEWFHCFDKKGKKKLPLFGHHSKNPFDFIFFLFIKYPFIGFLFYPLIVLDVFWAAVKPFTYKHGSKKWVRDTSGKIKAFFKMKVLKMKILKWITIFIIKKSNYYKSWEHIFNIYHDETHRVHRALLNSGEFE